MHDPEFWNQYLSKNPDFEGGMLIGCDGVILSSANTNDTEYPHTTAMLCAAAAVIARDLIQRAACGSLNTVFIKGEAGYVILMPAQDEAVLAIITRNKQ
jgi:predicted regulator of Ras-like GTPase activity (Roadblock/LC7/MglB family)